MVLGGTCCIGGLLLQEKPFLCRRQDWPTQKPSRNGATPLVGTQPSSSHSSLEDTLVALYKPPTRSYVKAIDAALQARAEDLPDVRLLWSNYMLYELYQDWVHQNPGEHLDGGIAEYIKWQARSEKLVCMLNQRCDAPSREFG